MKTVKGMNEISLNYIILKQTSTFSSNIVPFLLHLHKRFFITFFFRLSTIRSNLSDIKCRKCEFMFVVPGTRQITPQ